MKKIITIFIVAVFSLNAYAQTSSEWETYFEKSNYMSTPDYNKTMEYFQKLADYSPYAKLLSIGVSPQGRNINCLIVSKDKKFKPSFQKQNNKPIILIENGIHSGEIEGKDACMLLLRDILITKEKIDLIENVTLYIIPIFNVDGHERMSPYNRINQNGPTEMGWRTTAQNYNLNRDFMKADTPEMKAFLNLYNNILPDVFIDVHTTNGADYQYTITHAFTKHKNVPPQIRKIVREELIPLVEKDVEDAGYLISPYSFYMEGGLKNGIEDWLAGPRYSHGYAALQNRIGLLIETHVLKPYKDRVYATKALLESMVGFVNDNPKRIVELSKQADDYILNEYYGKNKFPLKYRTLEKHKPFLYKGIKSEMRKSDIAGDEIKFYTGEKFEQIVKYFDEYEITDWIDIPEAYYIPREWDNVISILKLHGIKIEYLNVDKKFSVEKYKFKNLKYPKSSYENRFLPSYEYDTIKETVTLSKGSAIVKTNQRALGALIYLLEPKSRDSFVKWGFFNQIFERKEYFEYYSMEPIAQKMYKENPELKKEFDELIKTNKEFANSSWQRLSFFYKRSPYYDKNLMVYPILKLMSEGK